MLLHSMGSGVDIHLSKKAKSLALITITFKLKLKSARMGKRPDIWPDNNGTCIHSIRRR